MPSKPRMSETPLMQCTTLAGCSKCSANGTHKWLTEIKLRFDSNIRYLAGRRSFALGYLCAPGPQLLAHSNQVCQGAGPHFVHDLTALNFDSNLAGAQFGRDLFVEQAGDDSFHHLPLARRE